MKRENIKLIGFLFVCILSVSVTSVFAQGNPDLPDHIYNEFKDSDPAFNYNHYEDDIRKQTVDSIKRNFKINHAIFEAKGALTPSKKKQKVQKDKEVPTMTSDAIIQSLLKPEFLDKKIDLDFDETNIGDIIMTLSASGQFNTVLDPVLKNNKIDLHLEGVTIKEALLLLSNAYDLGFKRVDNSLFITTEGNIRQESKISKVIALVNISADQAASMVEDIVESVNVSEEINSLIVTGGPDSIVRAEEIIAAVDKPQPQVNLEAKIIEINKDALRDLGIDWSDQLSVSYQESDRQTDLSDTVSADRSIFEVSKFQRSALYFSTMVKMLESQNKAKILSNPRITTLNNKEAEIFVGDEIPYTITNVSGGVATTEVRFVEPGIRLRITPSIIGEDFVVLRVDPEVSFIFGYRGPNDEYPHVKTREATAHVRVKNRQPFIIGGLLNQEDKKNLYKVPVLGDLPLLGNLFSYEKHTVLDTELIITIIPTIVTDAL